MFTLIKVVGERARSATTFTMITNNVCQLYHNWSKTGGIQLWMVLPWIWVVLWICNAGDLALTCANLRWPFKSVGADFPSNLYRRYPKNV